MARLLTTLAGAALALALLPTAALSQAASSPAPSASGPGMGRHAMHGGPHGMHHGGKGMHRGPRADARNTPGWGLMTPEERNAHRDKMMGMKTAGECQAYMNEHHEQMVARAKEKGATVPAMPRRDPCGRLPKS